ncbi:MAG TPA: tetratricopeptide repeat protein [Planctomycetaceae bacterium]|nr:tetratricopeptide repeat protein [Planctomycetaceae bacterium]
MRQRRLSVRLIILSWVCCLALGCVSEQTNDGSFTTGGPGQYGQPAPGASAATSLFKSKRNSDSNYTPTSKARLAVAQFQEQRGYHEEARKSYAQVLASDAKSIDAIIGLARLDQVAGRTADAEAGFQKAIRIDSRSGQALDALGQFYADQKRWTEAVATLQRAMAAAPEEKSYRFHCGLALAKSGQMEQALAPLVEAVGSAAAHYNLGLIRHERGELPASEQEFMTALIENPRLQQAQYWLAEVRREQEKFQLAGATGPASSELSSASAAEPWNAKR